MGVRCMKLLISDYDGTFKTDTKNIKLNVEAIEEFMGDIKAIDATMF